MIFTNNTKIIVNTIILFLFVGSFCFAADYYEEKDYTSGSTISLAGKSYQLSIGNSGTKARIENTSFSKYISLDNCINLDNTNFCFIENLSESKGTFSIFRDHGLLNYKLSENYVVGDFLLYTGQDLIFNMTLENTGNLTIDIDYVHDLKDYFDIVEYENCYFDDGKIKYNKSIEKEYDDFFSYTLSPKKEFKSLDFTPELNYYDGVYNNEVELEEINIESKQIYYTDFYFDKEGIEIGSEFKFVVELNNSFETNQELNYSVDVFFDENDFLVLDTYRFRKTNSDVLTYNSRGSIKNGTMIQRILDLKALKKNNNNISVKLNFENLKEKIDYELVQSFNPQILFTAKPEIVFRMREYKIGDSNLALRLFFQNNAEYYMKNLTINVTSEFLNKTYYYDKVDAISEVAVVELPKGIVGDKILKTNITYKTEFDEEFWVTDEKLVKFSSDNALSTINDTSLQKTNNSDSPNFNNSKIITNNTTQLNQSDNETIVYEKEDKNNHLILLSLVPVLFLLIILIYQKIIKVKLIQLKEKRLLNEIDKIKNEISKKEVNKNV